MTPIFLAKIEDDGSIRFSDREGFERWKKTLVGYEVEVIVEKPSFRRTNAENNYYWGVVVDLVARVMGVVAGEAHEFLKWQFLRRGVERNGKRWEVAGSSAKLSIPAFEEYVQKIRDWAAVELNTIIPLPNEIIIDPDKL